MGWIPPGGPHFRMGLGGDTDGGKKTGGPLLPDGADFKERPNPTRQKNIFKARPVFLPTKEHDLKYAHFKKKMFCHREITNTWG